MILALPYLLTNPQAYLIQSFDLSRVFMYEWTVNWKFIGEELFLSRVFHVSLLVGHLTLVWLFGFRKYTKFENGDDDDDADDDAYDDEDDDDDGNEDDCVRFEENRVIFCFGD